MTGPYCWAKACRFPITGKPGGPGGPSLLCFGRRKMAENTNIMKLEGSYDSASVNHESSSAPGEFVMSVNEIEFVL
ncbi:hypothetical protein GmHk_08G021305 [Glycine max]|nr:hypothetical protein GmHk_08G021305 [Glycine max]